MNNRAFTLLEIIITIAIIGVLAVGVFVAVDPAQRLGDTEDCIRDNNALAMQKKLDLYIADSLTTPATLSSLVEDTYYMLVTDGGSTSGQCECATLDTTLDRIDISGILGDLPVDSSASDDDTGYFISRSGNNFTIGSCNATGDLYEAPSCGEGHTDNGNGTCTAEITASTGDGYLTRGDCQTTASTAASSNTSWTSLLITSGDDEGSELARTYLYFDTSSIDSAAIINSASLKLVRTATPGRVMTIYIQGDSTGTYPSSVLTLSDFNKDLYNITDGGTFTSAQMTLNTYTTHDLSANGLNIIQKGPGAVTKFVLRDSPDVGATCASVWLDSLFIGSANLAGKEPKIVVTYTPQ